MTTEIGVLDNEYYDSRIVCPNCGRMACRIRSDRVYPEHQQLCPNCKTLFYWECDGRTRKIASTPA